MEVDHTTLYGTLGAIIAAITAVGARTQLSHNEMIGRMKSMADSVQNISKNAKEESDDIEDIKSQVISIINTNERFARTLNSGHDKITKLVTMHEHPDDYDFGSAKTNESVDRIAIEVRITSDLVRDSTSASREATKELKELTGLLRLSLQQTGKPDRKSVV
jgi:cytochrome c556